MKPSPPQAAPPRIPHPPGCRAHPLRLGTAVTLCLLATPVLAVGPDHVQPAPPALAGALALLEANSGRSGVAEVVILHDGVVLHEGPGAREVHGVWSCTKSFLSTTLGLLIEDGRVELDTRAATLVPALQRDYPAVSLRHFATMSSGYSALGDEPKPNGYAHGPSETPFLPGPPRFAPGAQFEYWDSAMNMFALALTRAAKEPLVDLFRRRIAGPLGFEPEGWRWGHFALEDGTHVNSGAGNYHMLELSAVNMAKFGQLFLQEGRWAGRQVLSAEWVRAATRPQRRVDDGSGRAPYGFNWWCFGEHSCARTDIPDVPRLTYCASGYNNNKLFVVPEWRLVVVRLGLDQDQGRIGDAVWADFLRQVGGALGLDR